MDLFDHRRPHSHSPSAHGLGVGHLGTAHPGEIAVYQIGAHFALQHAIAPVAHVLQHQQTQHHLGWRAPPTAAAAAGMPPRQSLVYRRHDFFVRQHLIGVSHPVFVQIPYFFRDQPIAEGALRPPRLNHGSFSRVSAQRPPDAADHG